MADTNGIGAEFRDVDWDRQANEDEEALARFAANPDEVLQDIFKGHEEGNYDTVGKDDDAQDFEDISDDDLPPEEEAVGHYGDVPGLTDDMGTSHDTDDLFGENGRDSSPIFGDEDDDHGVILNSDALADGTEIQEPEVDLLALNFPNYERHANQDPSIPSVAETDEELVKQLFPSFVKGVTINWQELLPPKKAHYVPKAPLKPPKVLNPTKISLDVAVDQEKIFRAPGPAQTYDINKRRAEAEAKGLIPILEDLVEDDSSDDGFDYSPLDPEEQIGGFKTGMIDILISDWESKINAQPLEILEEVGDEPLDDWHQDIYGIEAPKKRKAPPETDYINAPRYPVPNFDNYEKMTAHVAKKVVIDLNDPHLLVDVQEVQPALKRRRLGTGGFKRVGNGSLALALQRRFNYSNDEVYEALKEAHSSKVRATLSNVVTEHSLPAMKLQWPYYRVKLYTKDARSFHRPALKVNKFLHQYINFAKPGNRKKKDVRKLGSTTEIFKESKDLSLSDIWSTATLLEYSEEHPNVLSNFGMNNRITNYYRRREGEDGAERPQPEDKIGDSQVLLPEDKSPFANFGFVDPGETVRTVTNGMYRAPIFKHEPKNTDFLIIRSTTGVDGSQWHVRNIDNIFNVGQQFPTVEVPGPHSRKVTNAAKNRMKMVAFRRIKHTTNHHLKIADMTAHILDSTDMQNRQKLKEFLAYDKTQKVWVMKPGEQVPDEPTIRAMVTPEEVCLIDAMQVGSRRLEDAGYGGDEDDDDDDDVDVDENKVRNIEQDLAPWKTSKAFLEASDNKAMLKLHGEGDPSGCGQAFNMIKISMKGGFIGAVKGPQATSGSSMEEFKKQNGGHQYNVKHQQDLYNTSVREIWERQKSALSNPVENAEIEPDRDQMIEDHARHVAPTPRSMATPAGFDDSASQFSVSSRQGRAMKITRRVRNPTTKEIEEVVDFVRDPRVIREYQKRRHALEADNTNVYEVKPTGNAEYDRQEQIRVKKELARLQRNKDRRTHREAQKGAQHSATPAASAASPSSTPAPSIEKQTGTTRKCANCGQAGHIKTNKKLCPMLNGTIKAEDNAAANGGFGAIKSSDLASF